jgi:hypothetical protein
MSAGSFKGYRGSITRGGGTCALVGGPSSVARTVSAEPLVRFRPRGVDPRHEPVELREKAPSAFTLRLPWQIRKEINEELDLIRQRIGPEREAGGWLFAQRLAGHHASEQDICRAITAGTTGHARTTIRLSNPIETWWATGVPHWRLAGDWHSHTVPDSTLPSDNDMRAWASLLDRWQFARWLGVVVTRGEESGWQYPTLTGWLVRREYPELNLVCEPARIVEI